MIYIHPSADVQTKDIGENTQIWQHVIILAGAKIGTDCNINAKCFIESNVVIGNSTTIKCGVYIWDGVILGDYVFVGPNVTFTNDRFPRSKQYPVKFEQTLVKNRASIGAGSVLLSGVSIGENSMIGAGSVVTKDIPDNELWLGNPARFIRNI